MNGKVSILALHLNIKGLLSSGLAKVAEEIYQGGRSRSTQTELLRFRQDHFGFTVKFQTTIDQLSMLIVFFSRFESRLLTVLQRFCKDKVFTTSQFQNA